jgi:hypothetical protein
VVKPTTRLGYTLGIQRDTRPYERPGATNQEKFQSLVGDMGAVYAMGPQPQRESPGKGQRMAGGVLDSYLRQLFGTEKFVPFPAYPENASAAATSSSFEVPQ